MDLSTSSDANGRVELKSLMNESLLCKQLQLNVNENSGLQIVPHKVVHQYHCLALLLR